MAHRSWSSSFLVDEAVSESESDVDDDDVVDEFESISMGVRYWSGNRLNGSWPCSVKRTTRLRLNRFHSDSA